MGIPKMDRIWIEKTATMKIVRAHGNSRGWREGPGRKLFAVQNQVRGT